MTGVVLAQIEENTNRPPNDDGTPCESYLAFIDLSEFDEYQNGQKYAKEDEKDDPSTFNQTSYDLLMAAHDEAEETLPKYSVLVRKLVSNDRDWGRLDTLYFVVTMLSFEFEKLLLQCRLVDEALEFHEVLGKFLHRPCPELGEQLYSVATDTFDSSAVSALNSNDERAVEDMKLLIVRMKSIRARIVDNFYYDTRTNRDPALARRNPGSPARNAVHNPDRNVLRNLVASPRRVRQVQEATAEFWENPIAKKEMILAQEDHATRKWPPHVDTALTIVFTELVLDDLAVATKQIEMVWHGVLLNGVVECLRRTYPRKKELKRFWKNYFRVKLHAEDDEKTRVNTKRFSFTLFTILKALFADEYEYSRYSTGSQRPPLRKQQKWVLVELLDIMSMDEYFEIYGEDSS